MKDEAQELLMMFIRDGYSTSGKVSKSTAIKMMRFVGAHPDLQNHVNNNDKSEIVKFRVED